MTAHGMHYEGNCIRPPSEANSILLQVTLGCSHNKCTFCGSYKDKLFGIKDEQTINADIDFAAQYMRRQRRLFLMDGDALIIPQHKLIRLLERINQKLPWLTRIGAYANAKSIRKKTLAELQELKTRKLNILYLGVESGDAEVLRQINKGTTPEEQEELGKKVIQAGIKLSITVLLGIAGRENSLRHARNTGKLLSAIDPDYVGALTVMLIPGTELYAQYKRGEFVLPDQRELLLELREMIQNTNLSQGLFTSNHASNYLPLKIKMPKEKQKSLDLIDSALQGQVDLKPEWMRAL